MAFIQTLMACGFNNPEEVCSAFLIFQSLCVLFHLKT